MMIKDVYSELEGFQDPRGDHRYVKVEVISVKDELTIQAYFIYAERCVGSSLNLADAWDKTWCANRAHQQSNCSAHIVPKMSNTNWHICP